MKQERLTRKVYSMTDDSFEYCCNKMADKFDGKELIRANQKLGQLEDIEEELGIDLVTLFKAMKNGFYIKYVFGIEKVRLSDFKFNLPKKKFIE